MTSDSPPSHLLAELDGCHDQIRDAFRSRDLNAYMALFAPDLAFYQPDGRVFSRDALARSIRAQFRRLLTFDGRFERESLRIDGNDVIEAGTQTAQLAMRVLFIFAIRYEVERQGRYTWTETPGGWRLRVVHVDRVQICRKGFALASQLNRG